ncbi:response regulator transcription factor [Microbacterium sp. NPDC057407]|uniref:response regulator transcription factor n=1 Tax=Microbacterium sp. NPDC057407 TaxID=3346120 RepID=UPI003672BE31
MSTGNAQPQKVVIIEDDPDIRSLISTVLGKSGYTTVAVDNGADGVQAVLTHLPVLTTVDVAMPGIDGLETARRIRAAGSDTYIVMLTGLIDEADVIAGLGSGADDYLLKPFRPGELRARVEAGLRRAHRTTTTPSSQPVSGDTREDARDHPADPSDPPAADGAGGWVIHRDLQLHAEHRLASLGGQQLALTRTEFNLLAALLQSKGRVVSKPALARVLRDQTYITADTVSAADQRAVESHMTNLRRKLGDSATHPNYIETVTGVGYRLTPPSG